VNPITLGSIKQAIEDAKTPADITFIRTCINNYRRTRGGMGKDLNYNADLLSSSLNKKEAEILR